MTQITCDYDYVDNCPPYGYTGSMTHEDHEITYNTTGTTTFPIKDVEDGIVTVDWDSPAGNYVDDDYFFCEDCQWVIYPSDFMTGEYVGTN